MTSSPINENSGRIRKTDVSHDINQIADLIEMSFPIQQDPDGQVYIQKMRKAALGMNLLGWLSPWAELPDISASGFVWEENGRVVGNLSLIPFHNEGKRIYLVANVAVHPAFRRRGIAKALTQRALGYLRRCNESEVWLQVREDNLDAQTLYRSVGFTDRAVRTTWRIGPNEPQPERSAACGQQLLRRRTTADWPEQKQRLDRAYPHNLRWNYPLDFNRLRPGTAQTLTNYLEGVRLRHWTWDAGENRNGQVTWQKTDTYADNLWLAFDEDREPDLLSGALQSFFQRFPQNRPISIDYPKGRGDEVFKTLGFSPFRTLIWMMCRL